MHEKSEDRTKERMIHIRLDEHTHRELKILAAKTDATLQSVVEDLIKHKVSGSRKMPGRIDERRGHK